MYKRCTFSKNILAGWYFIGGLHFVLLIWLIKNEFPVDFLAADEIHTLEPAAWIILSYLIIGGSWTLYMAIFYLGQDKLVIDERGISKGRKGGKKFGFIPWEKVTEVGVFRVSGGERIVYVTTRTASHYVSLMTNKPPLNELIKASYSKDLIAAIKQHYNKPIKGVDV